MCINVLNKTCKNQLQPSDIQVFNYVQVSFVCVCLPLFLVCGKLTELIRAVSSHKSRPQGFRGSSAVARLIMCLFRPFVVLFATSCCCFMLFFGCVYELELRVCFFFFSIHKFKIKKILHKWSQILNTSFFFLNKLLERWLYCELLPVCHHCVPHSCCS